jgi:hypothetical protein
LNNGDNIVLHLVKGLVDDRQASYMWWKVCAPRISHKVLEDSIRRKERGDDFGHANQSHGRYDS